MRRKGLVAAALLAGVAPTPFAADVPLRDFARRPQYVEVRLSPDGEHLAVATPRGDETGVAVIRLSDMQLVAGGRGGAKVHAEGLWWANSEMVVVALAAGFGALEQPRSVGKLLKLELKNSEMRPLRVGHRAYVLEDSRHTRVVSPLREVRDEILIAGYNRQDRDPVETLERLNVRLDRAAGVARAPLPGKFHFVADNQGRLRFGAGTDPATHLSRTYAWQGDPGAWKEIGSPVAGRTIVPQRVSADGKTVYSATRDGTDTFCLTSQDIGTGATVTLACHDHADLADVLYSADGTEPLAAVFEAGVPEIVWVNPKHPDAVTVRSLAASFKGQVVLPVSWSDDGRKLLFRTYSDRNPGDYFLYDRNTKGAKYLLSVSSWIDPAAMAERRPVSFRTRDDKLVFGYLTLPPGRKPEKLPLVVMPHGGPFFVRDSWGWHADAQAMASRGYAVLQLNYRGSDGYGHEHALSGRRNLGKGMIDDIEDGVRWTIAQGIADPDRICASGGSYGAYSSLMLALRDPDAIKCVVAYAGVYDLQLIRRDEYEYGSKSLRTYLDLFVGDDASELRAQSPIHHLDKLKAPALIVHGSHDETATPEHAYKLRKALEARKHPFEWLMKAGEAHGFYNEDNRAEFYEKSLDFLDRHIGERRPASAR